MKIAVCVKHSPQRVAIDPLTAEVAIDDRDVGLSPADEAALELALDLGNEVTVITAGDQGADRSLRTAVEVGAHRVVRCPTTGDPTSRAVADALADELKRRGPFDLVLCGDYSTDRGSGSVPAFLAAELGVPQALGVVSLTSADPADDSPLMAERRLDRGRREILEIGSGTVVSVEGSAARLRRAALGGVLAARDATIDIGSPVRNNPKPLTYRVHRPRVQVRPAPEPTAPALTRIGQVTEVAVTREPPRVVRAEPADAAREILDQLQAWGYLE